MWFLSAAVLSLSTPVIDTPPRLALRTAVTSLLPTAGAPVFVRDELLAAVEALEELEYSPSTTEFHQAGVTGEWCVAALTEPEHPSALDAFQARVADVNLLGVRQRVSSVGSMELQAEFQLRDGDGDISGRLEVDGALSLTPMVDSFDLRTSDRRLSLPRMPTTMEVPSLMQLLHARLPAEFRAEEGVRLGMQTTYMDEVLRISRCTTGKLRGECAIAVRISMDAES